MGIDDPGSVPVRRHLAHGHVNRRHLAGPSGSGPWTAHGDAAARPLGSVGTPGGSVRDSSDAVGTCLAGRRLPARCSLRPCPGTSVIVPRRRGLRQPAVVSGAPDGARPAGSMVRGPGSGVRGPGSGVRGATLQFGGMPGCRRFPSQRRGPVPGYEVIPGRGPSDVFRCPHEWYRLVTHPLPRAPVRQESTLASLFGEQLLGVRTKYGYIAGLPTPQPTSLKASCKRDDFL
jgi:hypothetical protein